MLESAYFDTISKEITAHSLLFEGVSESVKALLIHKIQKKTNRNIIVICGESHENALFQDLSFFHKEGVLELPSWEALPGEEVPPSLDVMGRRLEVLNKLSSAPSPYILLTSLQSFLQKVVSRKTLSSLFWSLKISQEVLFEDLIYILSTLGYKQTKLVDDKGKFAVRGGIIDVFPISDETPYRIEFFGNTIEGIKTFDPMSQRSVSNVSEITFSHADEYSILLKEPSLETLLDYMKDAIVIFEDLLSLENHYVQLKELAGFKSKFFTDFLSFLEKEDKRVYFSDEPITPEMLGKPLSCKKQIHPFYPIDISHLEPEGEYIFLSESEKEESIIKNSLSPLPKQAKFIQGYLSSGFGMDKLCLIPFTEFSQRPKARRTAWRATYHTPVSDFHNIEPGDYVVHFHNGIGKYLGMEKQKNHLGLEDEFFIIEYAGQSKLYVPASQSHLISRYIGSHEEKPELHKLGTNNWAKTKVRAQQAILGYAKDLLQMQAERAVKGGFACPPDSEEIEEFANAFAYHATDDQLRAVSEITQDLMTAESMERLLCGDVGYGKTEVAMRSAFKMVADGKKQVAILVPTTVLALQHFETFKERMALFPVTIALVSRFQTAKENKETLQKVSEGRVDILVGTHRMIGKDVKFKDLGLVIIDEEQRFGVRAKEKLKAFQVGVDSLSMSATPIPRTLYLSLVGARKLSVINSPPQDRLPIKSLLVEREENLIKNGILRELSRDGQVYFIHNRVESIYKVAEELEKLVPTAKVGVVHGQLESDEIDDVFHAFKHGKLNVLVATTIIENGLDIPNANTIFIDRSDTFGISDLYQLRGRVGRWNKTAYAYFMIPKSRQLPEISQKRLNALIETSGFGGGMKLAMRDLELRGAGDILGVQQSGHVSSIGFHLYCKLLKRTIEALKKEAPTSFIETRLEFSYDAKLSSFYIPDSSLRLEIYHRLGESTTNEEVENIFSELKDRFGKPPQCVIWLYHMTRIRIFANQKNYTLLKFLKSTISTEHVSNPPKSFLLPDPKDGEALEAFVRKILP
ncbi:MAG: transcription-repair coupling factor [Chlamydiae bacterium]|nr:transcription-repair coupling factor [Chlamydiota bacterium]